MLKIESLYCEYIERGPMVCDINLGLHTDTVGIMVSGTADFRLNGTVTHIGEREGVFIPGNLPYVSEWYGENISFYSLKFDVSYNGRGFFENKSIERFVPGERYASFTEKCGIITKSPRDSFESNLCFFEMLDFFAARFSDKGCSAYSDSVEKAMCYLRENCSENIKMSDAAAFCCVSESQLYHEFKKQTGITPIEYKNRHRIQIAAELLSSTQKTTEEISEMLGFSSVSHFLKMFKTITGNNTQFYRKNKLL